MDHPNVHLIYLEGTQQAQSYAADLREVPERFGFIQRNLYS